MTIKKEVELMPIIVRVTHLIILFIMLILIGILVVYHTYLIAINQTTCIINYKYF